MSKFLFFILILLPCYVLSIEDKSNIEYKHPKSLKKAIKPKTYDLFYSVKSNKPKYYTRAYDWFFSIGGVFSFDNYDYSKPTEEVYFQSKGFGLSSSLKYLWNDFASELGLNLISFKYYNIGEFDIAYHNREYRIGYYYNHFYLFRPDEVFVGLLGLSINHIPRKSKNGIGGILGVEFVTSTFFSIDLRYELTTTTNHIQLSFNIFL